MESSVITPARAALPARSGCWRRKASWLSRGAARTAPIMAACRSVTVAKGRLACAASATHGANSKASPTVTAKSVEPTRLRSASNTVMSADLARPVRRLYSPPRKTGRDRNEQTQPYPPPLWGYGRRRRRRDRRAIAAASGTGTSRQSQGGAAAADVGRPGTDRPGLQARRRRRQRRPGRHEDPGQARDREL